MAATGMTPVQLELITSLSQDDIPIKLRCAICSKLAVNAFRLPCCEQAICENCQSSLPKACPVCEHTPVTPHDCTPHKSLRTTIKVFLRTEEKKRGALLAKAAKDTPPETPVEAAPFQIPEVTQEPSTDDIAQPPNEDQPPGHSEVTEMNGEDNDHIKEEPTTDNAMAIIPAHTYSDHDMDIPHESIEEIAPGQEHDEEKSNVDDASTTNGEGVDGVPATAGGMMGGAGGGVGMAEMGMNPMMGMMAGMGGDMSGMNQMQQMQMMMAMQGGMGGFPMMGMMGMPGLPMDPMAMQNMYGMGMGMGANNKSNMGMGMSNANMGANGMIGGNMGQGGGGYEGAQGGWNGQQAWNTGAGGDNFNANNAAGSSTNLHDFASSGYPNRGGFMRGGYQSHQEFGYGRGRGRGRGRGGFGGFGGGRGGGMWNQAAEFQQSGWNANMADGAEEQDVRKTTERNPNVDEFGREIRAVTPDEDAKTGGDDIAPKEEGTEGPNTDGQAANQQHHDQEQWNENHPNGNGEYNGQGYDTSYDQNYGHGYDTYNQQQGYGYNNVAPSQPPVDVPINAPTGPKAMREGLPNIGLVHLKGHKSRQGSASFGRPYSSGSGANNIEVSDRTKRDDRREGDRDKYAEDREREAERRERRERRHREGQDERSEDEKESERRRERRRRRREEAEAAEGLAKDEARDGNAAEEEDRARSASPTESKHESHRLSRRDKDRSDRHSDRDSHRHRDRSRHRDRDDKDRSDRDRDRDRERSDRDKEREKDKSSRSDRSDRDRSDKHRSSRSHRDRSRSRDRSERDKDEKSSRSSRRDRERDSERHSDNRSSRRHRDEEREKDTAPVLKPPTGPKSMSIFDSKGPSGGIRPAGGIQIKGASSRPLTNTHANSASNSKSHSSSSKSKEVDPHTAEREARNRERLLKEAQRMAGLAGLVGVVPSGPRKREREEERGGGRRKRRGKSGGGFDGADEPEDGDAGEGEEERIRRNEMEREGARGR